MLFAPEIDTRAAASNNPMLATLNPEQLAAVTLPPEHALILAGAGSGKTRVLTTRIAWLMQTGQIGPGGVMAVTFTNKAAKEMLTRLSGMLPVNVRGMWVGTFHGLCNRFLRAHWKLANLPQSFQILDSQDQLSSIKRLLKAHSIDEERQPPKELMWFINGCKEDAERPKDVATRDAALRAKVELYQLYEDQCQREGVVDFAELLLRTYELMRDNQALREHYQRRFAHVLIDEFQDTNKLQYAWVKMFGGGAQSAVFAVGDDDQSIYAFRGARVGNMAQLVQEFRVQHQIKLERNYRSYSNILDAANELIAKNKNRLGKNLRTEQGAGEPIRIYEAPSDFAEANWMVDEVQQLSKSGTAAGLSGPMPRKEIAVLYRSNAQSRAIETALFNAGVPYKVYGGLRFFERAEIKHALAYLRLLENKHDDTSFLRVVNFPPRGIGARSVEQLQDSARVSGCSLADAVTLVTGKAGGKVTEFVAMLDVWREQTSGKKLREIIEFVLEHAKLLEHYTTERDGQDRIENLKELTNAAESFVMQEGFGRDAVALPVDELTQSPVSQGLDPNLPQETVTIDAETGETISPLAAFLSHASLEAGDNQASAGQDAVQLMTVHSAKGLEFDAVFIVGLEDGLFPHENALADAGGLEEERRLMYVAITRARKRLYITHAQTRLLHGQTRYNMGSRFLDELPEHTLKRLSPPRAAYSAPAWGGGYAPKNRASQQDWTPASAGFSSKFAENAASKAAASMGERVRHEQAAAAGTTAVRVGQKVFHTKFGEGKVTALEGAGDDARAQVNFNRHGSKWLALSIAKLQPVD